MSKLTGKNIFSFLLMITVVISMVISPTVVAAQDFRPYLGPDRDQPGTAVHR